MESNSEEIALNMRDLELFKQDDDISPTVSPAPTIQLIEDAEEVHEDDAYAAVFINFILIVCVLGAYYVKVNRIYYLPESAVSMLVGVVIGGITTIVAHDLTLYRFSPEFFFFVLLPPIIFEAGYSLERKRFFENIGAITLFAMIGTITSTFIVGYLTFYVGKIGLVSGISKTNPMEALLFGALISAVDPVATLSIMGSPELQCNQLLYSLVFGESVLNDAIAIVLFKTFRKYYDPEAPDLTAGDIPSALLAFFTTSILSIFVGVGLGLATSYIYKHTSLKLFPKLETSLLFLCCYLCFATAEAVGLSGIMALFFNGIILSHYNSYNLSHDSRHSSEQIFETLATVMETMVFLYMGMGVFTGKFNHWNWKFSAFAYLFCLIGRAANIFPLSWISNRCRRKESSKITSKMQVVLWFAGLRGAIAFALAENMPGPNRETYATGTLTICLVTTVVCGGFTEKILTRFGMKETNEIRATSSDESDTGEDLGLVMPSAKAEIEFRRVSRGIKGLWNEFDSHYLHPYFGGQSSSSGNGPTTAIMNRMSDDDLGDYELSIRREESSDEDESKNLTVTDMQSPLTKRT